MAITSKSIDQKLVQQLLLDAPSVLDFLRSYFELRTQVLGKPGYSVIAQRAGFPSRSHVRDILTGRVQLTERSLNRLAKALGFKGDSADYFYMRAKAEEIDRTQKSGQGLHQQMLFLKHKILNEINPLKADDFSFEYGIVGYWIVPCLSTQTNGATLEEIRKLCPLSDEELRAGLQELVAKELVSFDSETGKYKNHKKHNDIKSTPKMTDPKDSLRFWSVIDGFSEMRMLAERDFVTKPRLREERPFVWRSVTAIPKSRYAEFKNAYHALLNDFIVSLDGEEKDDVLIQLVAGMSLVDKPEK